MKIFVAGATGAIGRPLVARLVVAGHDVVGMTRSPEAARALIGLGATPTLADALDPAAVRTAVMRARPAIVVEQLTALPQVNTPEARRAARRSIPPASIGAWPGGGHEPLHPRPGEPASEPGHARA